MSLRAIVNSVLLLATFGSAQAATTLYTGEAAYLAAVGATQTYITFDGSPAAVVDSTTFSTAVWFQSSPGAGTSVFHNSNAITDLGGNANQPNGVGRLFAVFTQPTYAFGFNYVSGGISLVAIVFNVAGCCEALDTTGASGFIGVVSDTSMASADFFNAQFPNNGGADRYFIDDFRINAPIPEPATVGLMALGLLGVAGLARRRSRTA